MKTGRSLHLLSQNKFVSILQYGNDILGNGVTRKILIYTIKFIKSLKDLIRFDNYFFKISFTLLNLLTAIVIQYFYNIHGSLTKHLLFRTVTYGLRMIFQ